MKKVILLSVAFMLAVCTASAQQMRRTASNNSGIQKIKTGTKAPERFSVLPQVGKIANGMNKAPSTKTSYQVPASMPSVGLDKEGYPLDGSILLVPTAYTEFMLKNTSSSPKNTRWYIGGQDYTKYFADDNYNFVYGIEAGYGFPMPTLTDVFGSNGYTYGDKNIYDVTKYPTYLEPKEDVYPLTWSDPHLGKTAIYGGYLDTSYIFGSGSLTYEGVKYASVGCIQSFPKPQSPMYVEDIYLLGVTINSTKHPLANNEEIKMQILNNNGDEITSLTATKDDVTLIDEAEQEGTNYKTYNVLFKKIENGIQQPLVLDEAFSVLITFPQSVNIGFFAHINSEEETAERAYNVLMNTTNPDDIQYLGVGEATDVISLPLTFSALHDFLYTWESAYDEGGTEYLDVNVLYVSADGKTVYNAADPSASWVYTYSACPYFNQYDEQNYYLADKYGNFPSWLKYGVDNSSWEETDPDKFWAIFYTMVECDPLPEGVTGRGCKMYNVGRGITDPTPIYVLQGNYTKEQCDQDEATAITNPTIAATNGSNRINGTFNLSGQRVGKNFKGMVINNGKKFIKK
ncbi:MAG: hypothetical protein HUK06_02415 [Bacteroidaceae bacterium]|nr:hypothetical protein [Bacteroidaceae bacterium]